MRLVKRLMIAALLLLVTAVGGFAVFLATADFSDYKDTIAAQIKQATGRNVRIGGKIDADLLSLSPAVVVNDLSIANTNWGTAKAMVRVKRLEVQIALLPLLSGNISVKRMIAIEPTIFLETDAKGQRNWVFSPRTASAAKVKRTGKLAFNEVRVVRARISYRDGSTGDIDRFGITQLTLTAKNMTSPVRFNLVGSFDRKEISVKGRIGSMDDLVNGRAAAVRFEARFGGSDLAGNVVVQSAAKIAIKGTVSSRRLDTSDFGPPGTDKRLFGEDPLPVGLLRVANLDIAFKASKLKLGRTVLEGVSATVRIHNSVLTVENLLASLTGGKLVGKFRLDAVARPARITAKLDLRGVSLSKLKRSVSGPMTIKLDVRGSGESPRAIASTLAGRVALIGGPGRVTDDALALVTFGTGTILNLLTRGSVRSERVNCVVARFDFVGGIGRSRVVVIDTARLTYIGRGTISLRNESMNILMVPATKDIGLGDVTLQPIRISGPLRSPGVSVDSSAAAKETAKNIFGIAGRTLNFVGSLFGVTKGPKRRGNPCPSAIALAQGTAPATISIGAGGQKSTRPKARRKKNLLQRLNPFD
ncbi:MAG: AsmA family protein [Alphaproteobacteria bacterium]|nr:AsmA family protein [Alphaproteobacteria bacterium]